MAAFKEHCAFGFWKGSLIVENARDDAMGQLGRITELGDLPPKKTLTPWVRKAMKLNEEGVKAPRSPRTKRTEVTVPEDLQTRARRLASAIDWMAEGKSRNWKYM
jgi:hypothetical protein